MNRNMVAKPAGNKVRLYARVSTEEQATEGLSIETQLKQLHAHARSQKWEITGEDIDPGFSGATEDRPGLRALRNGARRREFDIVAVSRLDRFFRNLRFLLNYLHEFEELGIKFISTQEGLDTSSPFGKSAVQIMGVIAEFERDRIAERIRDCRRYRLDQGLWTSGRTPYGYRWLPREQRWEVVADEARVVQYIYHLYLDEKLGTMQIPARLNAENYHTRSGGIWHFSNVLNMLGDPVYKGRHRTGIGMPVIVTETIWEKAQRRRLQARQVRGESRNWLLQGLCVCGLCGHRYKCHQNSRTKLRYYVCRGHLKEYHPDGSHVCPSRWENATNLEFLVWNKVKAAFNDPVTLNKYVRNALAELEEKNERIGKDVLGIEQELATIKRRKEKLGIALGDEAISEEKYREQLGKLEKQEMSLKQRRHNLDPDELAEVTELSGKIAAIKAMLQRGRVQLTDLGLFVAEGDNYIPIGFNPWPETSTKMAIGKLAEMNGALVDEEIGLIAKTNLPPGFLDPNITPAEKKQRIVSNMRALLLFLGAKVIIYPDRKEIRGAIHPQIIKNTTMDSSAGVPITSSAKGD